MPPVGRKPNSQRTRLKRSIFSLPILARWLKMFRNLGLLAFIIGLPAMFWYQGGYELFIMTLDKAVVGTSTYLGLAVQEILVEGRNQTSAQEIYKVLKIHQGEPLLKCSPEVYKKQLETLPWVQDAVVQRRWPKTIYIRLREKHPIALWQDKSKLFLIDENGNVIRQQTGADYKNLIVVVGKGAPQHTALLLKELEQVPEIKAQVTAAIFIGERRWDLILHNKLRIKLPEEGIVKALGHLLKLEKNYQGMKDEILAVDLRLPDRSFLIISPESVKKGEAIKETHT